MTIILALACIATAAAAQNGSGVFLGAGAGMNFGFDGYKYDDRPTSHNGAGWAGDFYLGGWLNSWLGARAGYQGFGISDRYTDFGNRKYGYIHGDVLLRVHRNIIPYLHGGYVTVANSSFGGGAGIAFPIHLGEVVSIVPDLKATCYSGRAFDAGQNNLATTVSATVGLAFSFGRRKHKKAADTVDPVELMPAVDAFPSKDSVKVVRDTVVIKEIVREVRVDTVYVQPKLHETISAKALFDTDSAVLRPEASADLDRIAEWLQAHPETSALVEGHTDSTASAAYNQGLSERRAQAVYNYLCCKGISSERLSYKGFGLTRPVATNGTEEGRQLNRRVEIRAE